jgi:hypothetical protein
MAGLIQTAKKQNQKIIRKKRIYLKYTPIAVFKAILKRLF